jgi:hypothetical protein
MPENFPNAMYDGYSVTRSRASESGVLVIPVAGPKGTPPKIVRVHGGLETETVSFAGERVGAFPAIPAPEIQDPNVLLLDGVQHAKAPMIQQQGPHIWTITGAYSYVHKIIAGLDSPLPVPQMPFDLTLQAYTNTIPVSAFDQQIVGNAQIQPQQNLQGTEFILQQTFQPGGGYRPGS